MDSDLGESNHDIDRDPIRKNKNQKFLFEGMDTYKKLDVFEEEVKNALTSQSMDNLQLYQFCLDRGFLPKHVNDLLKKWHKAGILNVSNLDLIDEQLHWACEQENEVAIARLEEFRCQVVAARYRKFDTET